MPLLSYFKLHLLLSIPSCLLIVMINLKQEVATWKAWYYLAKYITKHKLPKVPMLIHFWPPRSWRLLETKDTPRRPKMAWRIYWKKYLTKISQQPQKPPSGTNQIWAMTSGKKDTSSNLRGHCIRLYVAAAATPPAISNIPICRYKIKGCYVHWFKLWPQVTKIHPIDLRGH